MTPPSELRAPSNVPRMPSRESDEALVAKLAYGDERALRSLHQRYAALIFTLATRYLDATNAEEVVQDAFITLWNEHRTFDPARGTFKSWFLQVARRRTLNELRRKHRDGEHGEAALAALADDALEPDQVQWLAHRRGAVRAAIDTLPAAQRNALSLAYFEELTHEQIALALRTPRGITKTRIRTALKRLAPALLALVVLALLGVVLRRRQEREATRDAALRMLTSSDVVPLHLASGDPGVPLDAQGTFRTRPGATVAVLTTNHLPALASPEVYAAWGHGADRWRALGRVVVEADGPSLLVSSLTRGESFDEVRITRERSAHGVTPLGAPVLTWISSP